MEEPHLIIVTADKLADTGTVSFKFMFDSDMPRDLLVQTYNKPYGYVWQPDMREDDYSYNVWQSGSLVVGGGWSPGMTAEFSKEMAEAIPPCTLLMRTAVFEWLLANVLTPLGITYTRHHYEGILATN